MNQVISRAETHCNLFAPLFHTALPHMKGYQSDLGWDAVSLSRASEGDRYLWGWRELGTHMVKLDPGQTPQQVIDGDLRSIKGDVKGWYLLTVTHKHGGAGCAEGTCEKIGA